MITEAEGLALVRVLSLAENSSLWTTQGNADFQDFMDESYAAIVVVRDFLKANGIVTPHELFQRLAARQESRDAG